MNHAESVTLKIEGRLAGPWVQEVTRVWVSNAGSERPVVIDLSSVTFIDTPGRALLTTMSQRGARFIARDCLTTNIVAEIQKSVHPRPDLPSYTADLNTQLTYKV
jgi:anti-anti-sigma regulatory factor